MNQPQPSKTGMIITVVFLVIGIVPYQALVPGGSLLGSAIVGAVAAAIGWGIDTLMDRARK